MTLTPYEEHLSRVVLQLREELEEVRARRLPAGERGTGWEVFAALMEDLRDEGRVRLSVSSYVDLSVTWEPV